MDSRLFFRGEIYMIGNLWDIEGSEQRGNRPVLIIQSDDLWRSPTVTVLFITSKLDKNGRKAHVWLPPVKGLSKKSMVLCEQVRTVDKTRLNKRVATLDMQTMNRVDRGLKYALGIMSTKQKKQLEVYDPKKQPVILEWRTRETRREELLSNARIRRIPKSEVECIKESA